jgi:hypothetical protein
MHSASDPFALQITAQFDDMPIHHRPTMHVDSPHAAAASVPPSVVVLVS